MSCSFGRGEHLVFSPIRQRHRWGNPGAAWKGDSFDGIIPGPRNSWSTGKIGGAKLNPSLAIWMDSGLVICVFGCSVVGRWRADVLVYNYLCTEQCGTTKSVLECFSQLGAGWVWVGGRNPSLQEMAERLCDAGRLCTLLCGCPHCCVTWRWGHV